LLPVKDGEKGPGRNAGDLFAALAIGESGDDSVLLPVTIRGEVPGRAMRGSASIRKASAP
ncbi:hypothetical protein EOA35_35000, partial [Mesorhizobium sp. M8A.F.Ca.ET.023.01.1.1]